LPVGVTVCRLDENILARLDLENLDRVIEWILSFWPSVADMTARGVGACLIVDATIVSWCLSVFLSAGRAELGVETAPPYRGRNFATIAAAACIEECLARGIEPVWQCDLANRPSLAVAEKVGFLPAEDYVVWGWPLDAVVGARAGSPRLT
jgi:RimJ/RimL family protein N-acetyltransferase